MSAKTEASSLLGSNDVPAEEKPSLLTLTPATIRLGFESTEIFQLSNITRIGKYKVKSNKVAYLVWAVLFGIPGIIVLSRGFSSGSEGVLFGSLVLMAIAGYFLWLFNKPGMFAFGFQCSSGTTRYLYTSDEKFIAKVIEVVSSYMEDRQKYTTQVNVDKRTIIDNRAVVNKGEMSGNITVGDVHA